MNSKWSMAGVCVGLAVVVAMAPAQERVPEVTATELTLQEPLESGGVAAVGTAEMMTYQGYAEKAGAALNNTSMVVELRAFPTAVGGAQQGVTVTRSLSPSEVYKGSFAFDFDAALLALPDNADETYLEVAICSPAPCTPVVLEPRSLVAHAALAASARSLGDVALQGPNGSLVVASSAGTEAGVLRAQNVNAGVTSELKLDASAGAISAARSDDAPTALALRSERAASYTQAKLDDAVGEMRIDKVVETATAATTVNSLLFNANTGEVAAASNDSAPAPLRLSSKNPANSDRTYMLVDHAAAQVSFAREVDIATAGVTPPPKLTLRLDGGAVAMAAFEGTNAASLDFRYGPEAAMRIGEDPETLGQAVMMVGPKGLLLSEAPLASESNVAAPPSNYVRFHIIPAAHGDDAQGGAAALGSKLQVQSVSSGVPNTLMQIDATTSAATFYGAEGVSAARVRMDSALVSNVAGPGGSAELSVNGTTGNVELKVGAEIVDRWTPVGDTEGGQAPNRIGGSIYNRVAPNVFGATIGGGGSRAFPTGCDSDCTTVHPPDPPNCRADCTNTYVNFVGSPWGTVGGGVNNEAGGGQSTVGGGGNNRALDNYSTIAGGDGNFIEDAGSTYSFGAIGGGAYNHVFAQFGTIPGGFSNSVGSVGSFAAGVRAIARAGDRGSFVWADGRGQSDNNLTTASIANEFYTTGEYQFIARAYGGFWLGKEVLPAGQGLPYGFGGRRDDAYFADDTFIQTTAGIAAGCVSDCNDGISDPPDPVACIKTCYAGAARLTAGGTWTNASDRNNKENITPVEPREVLEKVSAMEIARWNYKVEKDSTQHIGPMAQDFHAAFGLGDSDKSIATIDADGVALAAIQGLYEIVQDKNCEIDDLGSEISNLKSEISELKALVNKLAAQNGGGR